MAKSLLFTLLCFLSTVSTSLFADAKNFFCFEITPVIIINNENYDLFSIDKDGIGRFELHGFKKNLIAPPTFSLSKYAVDQNGQKLQVGGGVNLKGRFHRFNGPTDSYYLVYNASPENNFFQIEVFSGKERHIYQLEQIKHGLCQYKRL